MTHPRDLERLPRRTLGACLRSTAAADPRRPAIRWEDVTLTYGEWDRWADRVAQHLIAIGVRPCDRVGLWLDKRWELPVAFLGITRARAVAVPVNFKQPAPAQRTQVQRFGFAAVVTQAAHLAEVEQVLDLLPSVERVVLIDGEPPPGASTWDDVAAAPATPPELGETADDVAYLNLTSGTTGQPKAAVTTHAMIQWNTRSSVETLGYRGDDVLLCMFSVFAHPHELFARPLALGGCLALVDSLNVRAVARAAERHGVTWIMAVPSFYEMLAEHVAGARADLSRLRCLEAGGAHLPPEAYARLSRVLAAPVRPVWGSTETTGVAVAQPEGAAATPGTMGRPCRHYEVRVVDRGGAETAAGEVGEMWVRGPAVVDGYWEDPTETARHFQGGWYHTEDLVRRAQDGTLTFCGRRSEMMKVGGIRVFPLEIELVLRTHPAVADVVVVKVDEPLRGEVPRAVVVPRPGADPDPRELRDHCRAQLALYQLPRIIEIWDAIPRTPAGKVDRAAVAAAGPGGAAEDGA